MSLSRPNAKPKHGVGGPPNSSTSVLYRPPPHTAFWAPSPPEVISKAVWL